MHSCRKVQRDYLSLVVFHTVRAGAYWYKADGIYACAFSENRLVSYFVPSNLICVMLFGFGLFHFYYFLYFSHSFLLSLLQKQIFCFWLKPGFSMNFQTSEKSRFENRLPRRRIRLKGMGRV